jgi:hypothetical protein
VIDKTFTVEEAEAMIPKLEPIMSSIMEHKRSAFKIGEELNDLQREARKSSGSGVEPSALINKQTELEFMIEIISEGLEEIERLGAHPKDLDIGLVDFPSVLEGESVLLCWRYGEKSIDYYHGNSEGFAGRKPLKRDRNP